MKKFLLLTFVFFYLTPAVYSLNEADGYLALSTRVERSFQTSPVPLQTSGVWSMPFTLEGASIDYDLRTFIQFFPEAFHMTSYYKQDSSFLDNDLSHKYSFGFIEVQYLVARANNLLFNAGIRVGHYGFIFGNFSKPSFLIHLSPVISVDLFLGNHFRINVPVEIPIVLYMKRLDSFFHIRTGLEVLFDPLGTMRKPIPDTIFLGLGVEFSYTTWQSKIGEHTTMTWKPYFKISILY
ncbi:MAG: hypothetical protein ABUK01_07375 [Leptospirales bacterium]